VRQARFLLGPKWLLSHVLVVLLVIVLINLGFWQLDRLAERRDRNDLIEARQAEDPVPVEELLAPGDGGDAVDAARFRVVTATGTYDPGATVEVRNRTQDGAPGVWLLTPLVLDDGQRVGIVRGFVALGPDGEPHPALPPDGEVTVTGAVADPRRFDGTAPRDIDPLVDEADTLPGVILADESDPAEPSLLTSDTDDPADAIAPVPPPELSEGPHLSYAAQWFIFTIIALVGYPLILRRVVERRGKEVDDVAAGDIDSDGDGNAPAGGDGDDLDRELADLIRSSGSGGPGPGPDTGPDAGA
jgi:cytochrome oxidase assembly protein ShyY1